MANTIPINDRIGDGGPTSIAVYSHDSSGNVTGLVGADGTNYTIGIGPKTLTVGAGGRFSTLADAIAYRATQGHTLLTQTTGSITYTAGVDSRVITCVTNSLSTFVHLNGGIGVRLGGTGPIIRAQIVGKSTLQLNAPIHATFAAGTQVDVYQIAPVGIAILPGEQLGQASELVVPAFTTIFCPVKQGASIYYESTGLGGNLFGSVDTQNEVNFYNLILGIATHKVNSSVLKLATPSATNNQTLCSYTIQGCRFDTNGQDGVYAYGAAVPLGELNLIDNDINGTYDIVTPTLWRHLNVLGNRIHVQSIGDVDTPGGDQGEPTAIVIGDNTVAGSMDYPHVRATVRNNFIDVVGVPASLGEGVKAIAVEVRQAMPNQAVLDVDSNTLSVRKVGGTTLYNACGVSVGETVTGANTPTIVVRNNLIDVAHSAGAAGTGALSMDSAVASYSIKRNGNRVVNGALGANTDATGFV